MMKAKLLTAFISMLLFCHVAYAQDFSIRIGNNTNLRSIASLDGRVVETAQAGATLHVIGSLGKWFKISRAGGDVWMANWVTYTRVEGGGQAAAPAQNIDNCCFVDRQCDTDQDWTDGYWAFQNGQCQAPAQAQQLGQPASSSPASAAPADADNCCFLGWHCATDDDWQRGFYARQHDQCDHPGIAIEGSPMFTGMMKRVFAMIKNGAPHWHNYIINSGLQRVLMTPPGYTGFHPVDMTYRQGYDDSFVQDNAYHYAIAGILTHESCHAFQWISGTATEGWRNEIHCVEAQLAVHEALDPRKREVPWLRRVIANIQNPDWWWWEH